MTPPVFVIPAADLADATVGSVVHLTGAEGRHAATARRMVIGEAVSLVDGEGGRLTGTVGAVAGRAGLDVLVEGVHHEPVPDPRVVVVQALPKGDRGELAVELLTEVGVDGIVPWAAANCVTQWRPERVERAHRRWADACAAAGKQARRARFPVVEALASTSQVLDLVRTATLTLVLDEESPIPLASVPLPEAGTIVLVVGPEGGLTPHEREALRAAGARTVRLGPSVLRSSSAGMAAAAVVLASTTRWAAPPDGDA